MERIERMERPVANAGAARAAQAGGWQPAPQDVRPDLSLDALAERLRGGPRQVWPTPPRDGYDVSTAAVDALRNEVAMLRERLASAAPRRAVEEMDRAVTLLHRRVETLHEDGQSLQREERRALAHELGALRHSLDALRAPERHEVLATAIEALAGKVDRMAGAAVDPAEITRLQSQSAELRALIARALSADGLQALAGRIAACAGEVTRASEESARRVAAAAGVLERNAQALLAGTERLEQHLAARDDMVASGREAEAAAAAGLQREVASLHARLEALGSQMSAQAAAWSPAARADLAARLDDILRAVERRAAEASGAGMPLAQVVERHLMTLTERFREAQERLGRLESIETALLRMTDELRAGRAETAAATADAVRHVALKLSADAGAPAVLGLKRGLAALEARQEDLERRTETLFGDGFAQDGFAEDGFAQPNFAQDDFPAGGFAAEDWAATGHPQHGYDPVEPAVAVPAEADYDFAPQDPREPAFNPFPRAAAADARPMAAADASFDDADQPTWAPPRRAPVEDNWSDLARTAEAHAEVPSDAPHADRAPPAGEPAPTRRFARAEAPAGTQEDESDGARPARRRGVWSAAKRDVRPRLDRRAPRRRPHQRRSALIALVAGAAMVLATTAAGLAAWSNGLTITSALSRISSTASPTTGLPAPVGSAALQAAAKAGDVAAAFEVGSRYADGRGVSADMSAAVKWLGYALSKGMVPAAYRLGSLYETVAADYTEAARFYEWAANQGHVKAMHSLGVLYSRGQVPGTAGQPDWTHAVRWFEQAAERGNRDSQYNLGVVHVRGLAGAVNDEAAWKWFSLAAAQGDAESANKRDAVAQRMDADALARAGKAADAFALQPVNAAVNVVAERPEWEVAAPDDKVAARRTNAREVLAANTPVTSARSR